MHCFDGQIEVLGPSKILRNGTVVYDYIRIVTLQDKNEYLPKITIGPRVSSVLRPGTSGRFAFHKVGFAPFTTMVGVKTPAVEEIEPVGWLFGPSRDAIITALKN